MNLSNDVHPMFELIEGVLSQASSGLSPLRERKGKSINIIEVVGNFSISQSKVDFNEVTMRAKWVLFVISKNCLFWTRVSNPCLISKFWLPFDFQEPQLPPSSYPSVGAWSNSAIVPSYQPLYPWEDCYLVSQDLVVQQKFVGLAVVDVYGLENECACTK
ncbi:hypothetical protein Tco_1493341 [Tanacetum coccineum]